MKGMPWRMRTTPIAGFRNRDHHRRHHRRLVSATIHWSVYGSLISGAFGNLFSLGNTLAVPYRSS